MTGRLLRDLRRLSDRFGQAALLSLPGLLARAARLHLSDGAPRPRARRPRPERIVVSLSTIPSRAHLIGPTLRSLLDQDEPADRIVLALPRRSRRDAVTYPEPETLALPAGVDVLRCEDQGPATKFLSLLEAEPDALLVVVDDDVLYPPVFLGDLLAAHRRLPRAALALRGVRREAGKPFADLRHVFGTAVASEQPVDILFGTWGYLLPPGTASVVPADFAGFEEGMRWVDDIWLSAHLARAGVKRFVVPSGGLPIEGWASLRGSLSGGLNRSGSNEEAALAAFAGWWEGKAE